MSETAQNHELGSLSDHDLIRRHLNGDETVFRELVSRYEQEVFHFLMRFIGSKSAADDLFQETFLQVHLSLDSFDLSKRFKPWLFTIAANKARDQLRKNKRRRTASLSGTTGNDDGGRELSFMDLLEADITQPSEQIAEQETGQIVREVVEQMPDHLREVLILSYFNKMAYKDIAESLQIPLGTVKSRLHAAVGTFAEMYQVRMNQPPVASEA